MIKSNLKASQSRGGGSKGFTLVELLAVIVILAILVIIAVPSVIKMLNNTKKNAFSVEAENIIKSAKNAYSNRELNGEAKKYCYTLSELSEYVDKDFTGYTGSVYIDPSTDTYKIWISKKDFIINGSNSGNMEIVELSQLQPASTTCEDIVILACTTGKHNLIVSANGGKFLNNSTSKIYEMLEGSTQEIETPTKVGYTFEEWLIIGSPSSHTSNSITMGEENVVLEAQWLDNTYTLAIDPNGGTYDGHTTIETYELKESDTKGIIDPYKIGYAFDGWETISGTVTSFTSRLLTMGNTDVELKAKWKSLFTYTGTFSLADDGDGNWRIKFLTNGKLIFNTNITIDVFLVGGGGAGAAGARTGGGGGGYTNTQLVNIVSGVEYSIGIGNGGTANLVQAGSTSAFGYTALGGFGGDSSRIGGAGGSGGGGGGSTADTGGAGGFDGRDGSNANGAGGKGQDSTTREFGEARGDLYAGGGGGGGTFNSLASPGAGGGGGGGDGGYSGQPNTGGGGGGGMHSSDVNHAGGSGIVVIRNHRTPSN